MITRTKFYSRLIQSRHWQRLRRAYIDAHPLCEECLAHGRTASALVVHHVRPVEDGATPEEQTRLCFDGGNLRALCRDCHAAVHRDLSSCSMSTRNERRKAQTSAFARRLFGETPP